MDTNQVNCDCNIPASYLTVKKEGPNTGRKFYTCRQRECKFFSFEDDLHKRKPKKGYNADNFKTGSCYRCGRWGCEATDCEQKFDFFGNLIPEEWGYSMYENMNKSQNQIENIDMNREDNIKDIKKDDNEEYV